MTEISESIQRTRDGRPRAPNHRRRLHPSGHLTVLLLISLLLVVPGAASAQTVENVCRFQTWQDCGAAVRQELDRLPVEAPRIVELGVLWGYAYGKQLDVLRAEGRVEKSSPNTKRIADEIRSRLASVQIASDPAMDPLLKRYIPLTATVLEWAAQPLAASLRSVFASPEVAQGYEPLRAMNTDVQTRVIRSLTPYLRSDWRTRLLSATTAAAPSLAGP